ncbi:hypothetical protein MARBORIA2_17720 [Methanobrevibacter arboriphilus]|uniref:Uncharacterized protein n=1 Tax=Methanobrevibacter arboriphilus TaxID=39441 RepID=A0ACA8R6S7_METAZ|nr:hypothetical protein MarbSA_16430 [Methanobrevibacter arboriphilus]GLI12682.1 hypothetical protein MARBORIA2_17720 [Methanobrevibacter arboriphilus]
MTMIFSLKNIKNQVWINFLIDKLLIDIYLIDKSLIDYFLIDSSLINKFFNG